jgi:hypothetical protein
MNNGLLVTDDNELKEYRQPMDAPANPAVRLVAKIVSYVFHPLFVPVYIAWFMIMALPWLFAGLPPSGKILTIVQFFIMYSFFPLVTVLLAKGLGFLDSIYLKTQKERIIPFIACGIYYFWMCYVLRHQSESRETIQLSLAIFIASSVGLLFNIYIKISLHAISMGILVAFMVLLGLTQSINFGLYISIALFIAGLVCTARFIVSDHTPREVYFGFLTGVASMVVGVWADKILP